MTISHLHIDRSLIVTDVLVASAGFADVHRGRLLQGGTGIEDCGLSIAVKKLRPYGERDTCLRIAAVSASLSSDNTGLDVAN